MKTAAPWMIAVLTVAPVIVPAQEAPPIEDVGAPERGVARIGVVNGEVSVRRGDSGDWVAAAINAPMMVEDRLATGTGSRAEVQFDSANLIRIGAHAEIRLAKLEYGKYNVQVAHGTVSFRVLRDTRSQVELDTPAVSVRPMGVGSYRVYVQEDGQTEITVRLGTAEIYTPRGSEQLQAGQTMLVRGNPADPEFRVVPGIARDQWDQWNEQRDKEMLSSHSYLNVPHDIYGSEELDHNGRWVDVPSYGEVWNPAAGPDWAPYQNGRWAWEDYYGWTWVSYDPWGWAPYHYGRWVFVPPYGWCWYPGGPQQYWSPALVAFFGFGPTVGVGFGFGGIGWVALAPYEPLYAWWGHGIYGGFRNPGLAHGFNVTSINVATVYRNARVANGVMGVNAEEFRQGRFNNIAHVSGAQIQQAGLVRGQLPVAPAAGSLRYSNRSVAYTPRSGNIHFFSHSTPSTVSRVPFTDQQRAMQEYSRQPATAASRGAWRPVDRGAGAAGSSGWQRFGEPSQSTAGRSYYGGASTATTGYRPNAQPSGNGQQSIRVAPSLVKERPASKSEGSGSNGHATTHPSGGTSHAAGSGSHGGGHR